MLKRLLFVLVLLAVTVGGVFGWKYHQMQQAAAGRKPPPPPVVAVTAVRQEDWRPFLTTVGSVVATAGIDVTNEVPGKVSRIQFESGETVKEGQPLLQLDDAADRAELEGLFAAKRLAQLKYDRLAQLLPNKSASKADYDEARALLDVAIAAGEAKKAAIAKKEIRAPFAGRLGIRKVDLGQYLAPGSAIVPLESLDPIYVDFSLPERHLATLAPGQEVQVAVQAFPGETFAGRITAVNPGVDQGTRNLKLRATFQNGDHKLRPGMFAEVRVLLPQQAPVLTLPATAITYAPYGDSVFLVQDGDKGTVVQRRQVETGDSRDGRVAVTSGLKAGERVVSAGQVKLRNGMVVTFDDHPAPGERAKAP
ncbi:MAG: efflux RND transporter periplasmic adaptor subunit [Gammaproteobacteria bacterium]|jgi:membrane fusion protein (multidrug efflux system)|nr:efflux RND transporter periplasmic adaptor subunit [Gammaproteobacteria bacterium]